MNDRELNELIQQTVNSTVARLKLSGLMKDDRQTAFQKTEHILRSYNDMKKAHSENGTGAKFLDIVDNALKSLYDDIYYDIIPMTYFEGKSREDVAAYFDVTTTTISTNKRRLVQRLSVLIFSDDVIYELFL